jgi:hypothetical protein
MTLDDMFSNYINMVCLYTIFPQTILLLYIYHLQPHNTVHTYAHSLENRIIK